MPLLLSQAVAVVQRAMRGQAPEAVMAELGFGPLLLIKAFPVSMSGGWPLLCGAGSVGLPRRRRQMVGSVWRVFSFGCVQLLPGSSALGV